MAAIITEKFRIHNARQFKEDFGESTSSTFLFIGRPQAWDASDTTPTPANSVGETIDAYKDMIAMKKIGSADVSHCLVRRDWATGTTYDEYAHDLVQQILLPLQVQTTCTMQDTLLSQMSITYISV